ncbi:TAXI family TRAP transporter solute-binding subunit [Oceanobacillus caeni]|uniref:TAXI family TRAP transporter solute-binding subunit n=1 Tax=Oceanobacillus TaxID=182709 RepID=UPI00062115FB|nr:TAXI family TRAP transporter solute-binding subunit [Oceanobacillus caeni]KKE79237.1 C4-dicarboxylate ABC transporter substrate-binding protein [Bacilli bacterium VT-13-104]PZD86786.1 C4-dicarboxylate ABC transporter substrate-binding protein [Bacilli bacterium]MBU8790631.1 TAXI family TRAP transporter solute-binding subunit [Oceanobacillus caeni]MCR1834112.1 TAXI family TRAP transporter solute-binding subunit [Oceanobacillus caeni]PZD88160.1 C4-dicarboxylate ABC transporter substrate-bindi
MKKKTLLSVAMLLVLALFLAACGGGSNDSASTTDAGSDSGNDEAAEKPKFLSMLTGGTSGTYYPLGGEMAKIITDETGIQTDAVSSNASADNVISLQEGEAELAFVQTDVIANAVEGINAFDGKPVDNVLALGSLYPETIQIVTNANSGIESVEDLKGKTVSVGAPGSGTYINAEQILEIHGLTMDDIKAQNLDFGESTGGIQDGNIDAAFITAGTPTGAVEGLGATTDVSIVPIAQEKIDELVEKYPYYAADTITEGTYGLEEDVNTVAVLAMLAVTDSLSEDVVYDITKALYENVDQISHSKGEFIKKESALDGIDVDLHPGAEKYFKEAGLLE